VARCQTPAVAQQQKQGDQCIQEKEQPVQHRAPERADPSCDAFDIRSAQPLHENVGIAEVGTPPAIKIFADDRQLREPSWNGDSVLLQLLE
jgi:hypothetical protein